MRMPAVVDPRRRLRICLAGVFRRPGGGVRPGGAVGSDAGRRLSGRGLRPVEKEIVLPAARGRILARDGTVWPATGRSRPWRSTIAGCKSRPIRVGSAHGPGTAGESGSQECGETRRGEGGRVGRTRRPGRAAGRVVRAFAVAVGRPDAADSGPRRTHRRSRSTAAGNRQPTTPIRLTIRGPCRSADCCWKTRRRRESPWPRSWTPHVVADDVPGPWWPRSRPHADRYPGVKIVELSRRTYPDGPLGRPRAGAPRPGRTEGAAI